MQTILFANNVNSTTNSNQGITPNDSTNIIKTNEMESEVSFLECFGEVINQEIDEIENFDINLNQSELQINATLQETTNEDIAEIIIDGVDIEEVNTDKTNTDKTNADESVNEEEQKNCEYVTNSVNDTSSINAKHNMLIHDALNHNTQNYEIGEKKLDSVKYSLGNNLSTSMDDLLKKDILSFTDVNQETLNESEKPEGVDLDEFSGEIDLLETSLDSNKISSNSQTENDIETNDIETSQKEIFKQIREGIRGNSTTRSMQIMLKPHHLGKVNLNLKFFNNSMHINIFVENENVENLLRQNLEQIISTVNPTGAINIGSITVSKIEDLSKENSKEDNKYFDGYGKYKTNPFVHKIEKMNYYR